MGCRCVKIKYEILDQVFLQVQHFLLYVRDIYTELPNHMNKIFEQKQQPMRVKDLKELNIDHLLSITYAPRVINVENLQDSPPQVVCSLKRYYVIA